MRVPVTRRDERGAVALIVAGLVVVLVGISAFTVDFGMAYATKRQLSSAADAASLAADMVYKSDYKGLCTVPGNDPNNPVAANANVRRGEITFRSGQDRITEYESSPGKFRAFCSGCGSPVYSRSVEAPDIVRIRLGLLDEDGNRLRFPADPRLPLIIEWPLDAA